MRSVVTPALAADAWQISTMRSLDVVICGELPKPVERFFPLILRLFGPEGGGRNLVASSQLVDPGPEVVICRHTLDVRLQHNLRRGDELRGRKLDIGDRTLDTEEQPQRHAAPPQPHARQRLPQRRSFIRFRRQSRNRRYPSA